MKQYNLINRQTGQETICNKVTIDGLDYYTEDGSIVRPIDFSKYQYQKGNGIFRGMDGMKQGEVYEVIATTNPSIDLPKVVDEVERTAHEYAKNEYPSSMYSVEIGMPHRGTAFRGFTDGYNKSQETYPFSEEDMIDFEKFCSHTDYKNGFGRVDRKELLQLWREQKPKIVWYE